MDIGAVTWFTCVEAALPPGTLKTSRNISPNTTRREQQVKIKEKLRIQGKTEENWGKLHNQRNTGQKYGRRLLIKWKVQKL